MTTAWITVDVLDGDYENVYTVAGVDEAIEQSAHDLESQINSSVDMLVDKIAEMERKLDLALEELSRLRLLFPTRPGEEGVAE